MIKHHPKIQLLQAFVDGELPASLSTAIAIHSDMCPKCQEQITLLTEQVAENNFEQSFLHEFVVDDEQALDQALELDFDQMLAEITENDDISIDKPVAKKRIQLKETDYTLPRQLQNMEIAKPANIGKLARSRIQLDEGEIHTSLLHIEPGGSVPEHTHKGFELTLLLEGNFTDEQGEYVPGDFIMLDGSHQHHPISEKGCLCFTVANDALKFTQGINKLLNPIGSFIY